MKDSIAPEFDPNKNWSWSYGCDSEATGLQASPAAQQYLFKDKCLIAVQFSSSREIKVFLNLSLI